MNNELKRSVTFNAKVYVCQLLSRPKNTHCVEVVGSTLGEGICYFFGGNHSSYWVSITNWLSQSHNIWHHTCRGREREGWRERGRERGREGWRK